MKKSKIFIIGFICLFIVNVQAEVDPPIIVSHKVMVTNKEGAICYENSQKTDNVIPYGTTLNANYDIHGSYMDVSNDKYSCTVKYSDISSKTQVFNMDDEILNGNVLKIDSKYAMVLVQGGINLRKGPSVTYSKLTTVPEKAVITVSHKAGTYWYYTTYNGISGWVTAMNDYLGFEKSEILISPTDVKIYDSKNRAIGTIPSNTDITDYLELISYGEDDPYYYVIYNGIKGYIKSNLLYKIDSPGKIKLTKEYVIKDSNGKLVKKMLADRELEYTMISSLSENEFYIPELNQTLLFKDDEFEYLKKAKILTKKSGYLGEGKFGEEKEERTVIPEQEDEIEIDDENKDESDNKKLIIILSVAILLALIALVVEIIKLSKSKKKNNSYDMEV